jgi:hypothetical protein
MVSYDHHEFDSKNHYIPNSIPRTPTQTNWEPRPPLAKLNSKNFFKQKKDRLNYCNTPFNNKEMNSAISKFMLQNI